MKSIFYFFAFVLMVSSAMGDIIQQNTFTPAENGTLPSNLRASFDGGSDVIVTPYSNVSGVSVDHAGGDGYVLRLGNLGYGYDAFANPTTMDLGTPDSSVSAWVYLDLNTTAFNRDREYGLVLRGQYADMYQGSLTNGNGYYMIMGINCLWYGYSPTPGHCFIGKFNGMSGGKIGNEGATAYSSGWHKLTFTTQGSTLKAYVDGNLECTASDATFASGIAAMFYYDSNGQPDYPYAGAFDDFVWQTEIVPVELSEFSAM